MGKQVMALKQRGIKAEYLSSAQKDYTVQSKAERGQFDILFMTPEKACTLPTGYGIKLCITFVCVVYNLILSA
jgi:ATP-dependent DNA helicase RecQ